MHEIAMMDPRLLLWTIIIWNIDGILGYPPWKVTQNNVCLDEVLTIECPGRTNIIVNEATYGHLGLSECIEVDTGHLGCSASALEIIAKHCSGKSSCEVAEESIRHLKPCRAGLLMYLKISHMCVPAEPVQPCTRSTVNPTLCYIWSTMVHHPNCQSSTGSVASQFYLTSKQGQRIKLSILNLMHRGHGRNGTHQVGYIVDDVENKVYPIEVNTRRDDMVPLLTSHSNEVTVSIQGADDVNFLILFEAFGCEDLKVPAGMLATRHGDQTTIQCENSQRSWNLKCIGVHWAGVIGNCTEAVLPEAGAVLYSRTVPLAVPKDIIFMIIVGVTGIMALVIITVGYVCYKRTLPPLEAPSKQDITYNNLKQQPQPGPPALPQKRGSTLLRNQPSTQASILPIQAEIWEDPVPPPPPRREDNRLQGVLMNEEVVPLRGGDLLLQNGHETLLVRGAS